MKPIEIPTPINRLRLLLGAEHILPENPKGHIIERPRPPVPPAEEIRGFFEETMLPAFESIKEELSSYYREIRLLPRTKHLVFYVYEDAALYYCSLQIEARPRRMVLKSEYYLSEDGTQIKGRIHQRCLFLRLPQQEIHFKKFPEISRDLIIEMFNQSFFSRLQSRTLLKESSEIYEFPENQLEWNLWLEFRKNHLFKEVSKVGRSRQKNAETIMKYRDD